MEYYLYRNGKAIAATIHDSVADAKAQLDHYKAVNPSATWFMEDEDGQEIK